MTFYPEALRELVEEFQEVEDKRERLEMLFELAEEIMELPAEEWSEQTRVRGCQSEAHVRVSIDDGLVHVYGAADAKLVQGLMGVLSIAMDALTPVQAVFLPAELSQDMGLTNTLTPSRSNGFRNMYDKVMNEIRASVE